MKKYIILGVLCVHMVGLYGASDQPDRGSGREEFSAAAAATPAELATPEEQRQLLLRWNISRSRRKNSDGLEIPGTQVQGSSMPPQLRRHVLQMAKSLWDKEQTVQIGFPVLYLIESPKGNNFYLGASEGFLKQWDSFNGLRDLPDPLLMPVVLKPTGEPFNSRYALSPNGRLMALGLLSLDREIRDNILIFKLGVEQEPLLLSSQDFGGALAFSLDNKYIAVGTISGEITIYSIENGAKVHANFNIRDEKDGGIHSLAFSPDGKYIAAGTSSGLVIVCDSETGERLKKLVLGKDDDIFSVVFSRCGNYLAAPAADDSIHIFDFNTGQEINVLRGHTGEVYGLLFSPTGEKIASISRDGTMRIWHLRNNEQDTKESAESEQKEQAPQAVSPLDANKEYAREEVSNAPSASQAVGEEMPQAAVAAVDVTEQPTVKGKYDTMIKARLKKFDPQK